MYQNFSNDDVSIDEIVLDNDREYINKGFEPIGCLIGTGDYMITDFLGEFTGDKDPIYSGLYLVGDKLAYFNGDWWITPSKILYA